MKKTQIRRNIPMLNIDPNLFYLISLWLFAWGWNCKWILFKISILRSFQLFFRFNLYSETGDYNWLWGYSIELNPDKMNMCKRELHQIDKFCFKELSSCRSEPHLERTCFLSEWLSRIWELFQISLPSSSDPPKVTSNQPVEIMRSHPSDPGGSLSVLSSLV